MELAEQSFRSGRPISGGGLSSLIERSARAAGLPAKCVTHGLRKARMRRLAERGATTKEIASVSGHKTLKEVERYTEAADQAHWHAQRWREKNKMAPGSV